MNATQITGTVWVLFRPAESNPGQYNEVLGVFTTRDRVDQAIAGLEGVFEITEHRVNVRAK